MCKELIMARKVQKPDLNITLENPTQINAKKIANKKVMGIRVLNSSQRSQVYQGRDKISDAQSEIKDSQNQIDDTNYDVDKAFDQDKKADNN